MGAFFVYILKSSVCLSLFYLFYRLLLSKETFHRFNRIALLCIFLLSVLIPFFGITLLMQNEVSRTVLTFEQLLMMVNKVNVTAQSGETSITWVQLILIIYLGGTFFFVCRNVYSLIRLLKLWRAGRHETQEKGIVLVIHNQNIAPFSWLKFIFISEKDLEENSREILTHETAHIINRHSIDLLIAEICIFFQWFNPAAWLMKQELQNIHEYEADETVINQGIDAKKYQLLLIKKAVGTRLYSMANSFNHSKLKKRITMMLKEKSSPWARLKCLYVLPVAVIAITAFARPEISDELEEISSVKASDLTSIVEVKKAKNDEATSYQNKKEIMNTLSLEASGNDVFGTAKNVTLSVLNRTDSVKPAPKVAIRLKDISPDKKPLIIVDDQEVSSAILGAINPKNIMSVDVLKDKSAIEVYGDKGKNGVILIKLKSEGDTENTSEKSQGLPLPDVAPTPPGSPITYLVDGKKMTEKEFQALNLPKEQIERVDVKKNGPEGNSIEITTISAKKSQE